MEKKQAQEYIAQILQAPFDRDAFSPFIKNLLNEIIPRDKHYSGNLIPEAFREHICQYWRLGKYEAQDGEEIDILVIEVKTLAKLERARTALRNFVVNRLKTFDKDYALTAFYCKEDRQEDWRFSFVKVEHESFMADNGKVKSKTVLTPARRSSFLVGVHENSYTAQKQLLPLLEVDYANPTLDEIEHAFSIEKVTAEFFQQYKEIFARIKEHFSANDTIFKREGIDIVRFSKKLLGQIVFIYFLQKKGWMGVEKNKPWGSGDRRFLRGLYEQAEEKNLNFYNDYLRLLFYEALAKERPSSWYEPFSCKIPFLNGGLFEAEYDWQNSRLTIPNDLFHNTEKNKAGDIGTGILDVFDRYNFTIKEDEPLEKEVAVDPEMLGKVFENMLDVTERKSKGAFYTPREIVHYMCQESLIHYLDSRMNSYHQPVVQGNVKQPSLFGGGKNKHLPFQKNNIKVPLPDLQEFVRRGHLFLENEVMALDAAKRVARKQQKSTIHKLQLPESIRQHARELDNALADIMICDPAIGSGAFPVGLLHEIVTIRLVLQSYLARKNSPYELKLHAIQHSIYGVDLDGSAIDIARLRLWLSLIVDEEFDEIATLPNLDYKIVQGDSLIGFPQRDTSVFGASKAEQAIIDLKEEFFITTDHARKAELKKEIDEKIAARMAGSKKMLGYAVNFDFHYYFSEVWQKNNGFDVVIGNPPYVQIQKFDKQTKEDWQKQKYTTFAKTGDIYCLFYEKGGQLLKKRGCLAYITSNKWMRAKYGQKMRKYFLDQVTVQQLIDFGDSPIFSEATTYTNILLFTREKGNRNDRPLAWDLTEAYRASQTLERMLAENEQGMPVFSPDSFIIIPEQLARIKQRIEQQGIPLKNWDVDIYRGVLTGFNEAFIIDGRTKEKLIALDPKSAEILKPILRGRDIKRYHADFADLWLVATLPALNIDIDEYPAVRDYLKTFGKKLNQTGEKYIDTDGKEKKSRKKTGNKWFETQDQIAYHQEFEKEKIVWLEMSPRPNFTYLADTMFVLNTAYILTGSSLLYLLALLNSTVLSFYFPLISTDVRGKTRRYIKQYVENLPVPAINSKKEKPFSMLSEYLLLLQEQENKLQAAYFEQLIDGLVYELYFPEELQKANKAIFPHLGALKPLAPAMSAEKKLAVVQAEFDRLYDPEHPIRNNLETLDSVKEVRIIQQAVQR